MKQKWTKYQIVFFVLTCAYNYVFNFILQVPEGRGGTYSVFFIFDNLLLIWFFYINQWLLRPFLRKYFYFIPIQFLILLAFCVILTISPYTFYIIQGFKQDYISVYFMKMFGVASMMFNSIGFLFVQQWDESVERKSTLIRENATAELQFLRSQTNPHFLLNTMNSIYALALQQSKDTYLVISELKNIFLYLQGNKEKVSIEDEISYLKSLINIQKRRVGENLEVTLDILADKSYLIEPMLFITFIENAFKHGISMREKNYINVFLHVENNNIEYKVTNSNHAQLSKDSTSGIGQINLERRLELLYPEKYRLTFSNNEKEYCAILLMHLQ